MSNPVNVKSIVIVGGVAGWMSAAYLKRFLADQDCSITLVESPDIGTIGVGEATIPTLVNFVHNMELDELELMRRCGATYKLGIKFCDWIRSGHEYWHPFGVCGGVIDGLDLYHFWLKSLRSGNSEGPYSSYSLQALLAELDKAPRSFESDSIITRQRSYAYHLDANAFADYLREVATQAGVKHLLGDVSQVVVEPSGFIDYVKTSGGRTLSADLFIDCSGFHSLLIERTLGDPWVDWSSQLLCDRAVAARLPPDETMRPYTRSTALSAGWAWEIPLSERVGCGYVYSSQHIGEDEAARELLTHVGQEGFRGAEPLQLKMRVGRRQQFWKANCVSIGLAAGFLEPLESTGIFFIQGALETLFEHFPDCRFAEPLRDACNRKMAETFDNARDFVLLHYLLNQRDEAFWRAARDVETPETLRTALELYDECGLVSDMAGVFPEASIHYILSGGERLPRRWNPLADKSDLSQVRSFFAQILVKNRELAETLPSHQSLIDALHQ